MVGGKCFHVGRTECVIEEIQMKEHERGSMREQKSHWREHHLCFRGLQTAITRMQRRRNSSVGQHLCNLDSFFLYEDQQPNLSRHQSIPLISKSLSYQCDLHIIYFFFPFYLQFRCHRNVPGFSFLLVYSLVWNPGEPQTKENSVCNQVLCSLFLKWSPIIAFH